MELTNEEIKELRELKTHLDSDDIRQKEIIKNKLLNNRKLIYVLNNKELQEKDAEPDEYYGINILPYYMITPTQTNVQNFVCYEVDFKETPRYNDRIKYGEIIFYILCEQKGIIEQSTFIARHDLLAAIIMNEFNYTNYFGSQLRCISDIPSVVDSTYACRTLVFQMETPNNLVQTRSGKNAVINGYEVRV